MSLKEREYISESNTEMLRTLLYQVGRVDLEKEVEKFILSSSSSQSGTFSNRFALTRNDKTEQR